MSSGSAVRLAKIAPDMFPQVLPLLQEWRPTRPEATWRLLFFPPWETGEDYCGYGLMHGDRVVGFLGLAFSVRTVDGRQQRFCNLTTWYVRPEHRDHSISLLRPVLKLHDHTITDLSPSAAVTRISRRLGFETLDSSVHLLVPTPDVMPSRSSRGRLVFVDPGEIASRATPAERAILRDHDGLARCHALLAANGESYCLVVYTVSLDTSRPYCHIHHVGNPEVFAKEGRAIRHAMAEQSGVGTHVVDSRFVAAKRPPFSYRLPARHVKLYRSQSLAPSQIDNLYSEFVLLDLLTARSLEHLGTRAVRTAGNSLASQARSIGARINPFKRLRIP
jgi:hypothetical protein